MARYGSSQLDLGTKSHGGLDRSRREKAIWMFKSLQLTEMLFNV